MDESSAVLLLIVFVGWLLMSGFGAWVAIQRDREPIEGAILGLLFGPFGVLIEVLLPAKPSSPRSTSSSSSARSGRSVLEPTPQEDSRALAFLGTMEPPGPKPADDEPDWLKAARGEQ